MAAGVAAPAAALLGGCRRATSRRTDDPLRITFLGTVLNNPFWDLIQAGATAAGSDLDHVDLTYSAPEEFSRANINQLIKSAIAAEPDGIAIDYRGREFEEVTLQALDLGIAVQFFNNFKGFDSSDPRVVQLAKTAVGLDKFQAARRSAEAFSPFVTPGDPLVLFNGLPDAPEHLEIENAYIQTFTQSGWTENQLLKFPIGLDPAQNFQAIKTYLAAHPETQGIVCWDSVTGSAAARAKADAQLTLPVMTWNLDRTIIRSIKDGSLNMTLTQQPYLQAYYAVVGLYLKLKYGFTALPTVDPGTLIVDRSNVEQVEALFQAGVVG